MKPNSTGLSLPKAPSEKAAFIQYIERKVGLHANLAVDLDLPVHIQTLPPVADLGVWVDTWHSIADIFGTSDDAQCGVEQARDILYLCSLRMKNLIFSADVTKPPLDQFGSPGRGLKLLFESSTCYATIVPIATYKGRVVYWGSNPKHHLDSQQFEWGNIRFNRMNAAQSLF